VGTFSEVSNDKYGYTFSAPTAGWTRTDTTLNGMRELVAFVKDGSEGDVNISMVSTPIDWEKNSALFRRVADSYRIKIMDD